MAGSPFSLDEYEYGEFLGVADPDTRNDLIESGHSIYIMECHSEDYGQFVTFRGAANGKVALNRADKYNSLLHWYIRGRVESLYGASSDEDEDEEADEIEVGRRFLSNIVARRLLPYLGKLIGHLFFQKRFWDQAM